MKMESWIFFVEGSQDIIHLLGRGNMKNILKSNQISKVSILFICILLVSITHEVQSASFSGYVKKESALAEGIGGARIRMYRSLWAERLG